MIPVILSGGSGSRLWPVSRESYPKQFCEFFDQSFMRETFMRLRPFGRPRIVTLDTMASLTRRAVQGLGLEGDDLILEPLPKNTAAAIALMAHVAEMRGLSTEVLGIFPADHLISNGEYFAKAVRLAEKLAQDGKVVTLGIEPRYPATGYGYMELEKTELRREGDVAAFSVRKFHEKPNLEKAEAFIASRTHFWNAGIFFFKVSTIASLFAMHMPDLWKHIQTIKADLSNLKYIYANLTSQSIDYGVMEKLKDIICIPGDYGWSDVGSWDELARLQEEKIQIDSEAQVFNVDSLENFVYSNHKKVIGLCGVSDLIVVDTPDALLVVKRGESQKVKSLVDAMREAKRPEATEHPFEVRPWGGFEILSDDKDHKVKRLVVEPDSQLSYQVHKSRDEHWVVVSGEMDVVLNGEIKKMKAGEQIYVPRGAKHRIRNTSSQPVVLVEVQTGEYFGEDDIVRFEDDYNRVEKND